MADPIHQFQIQKIVDFGAVNLPVFGRTELAITNSHIAMTVAFVLIVLFMQFVTSGAKVVPGRLQTAGESLFDMIDGVTDSIAADESFYGDDRLQRELTAIPAGASAAEWVDASMRSVFEFAKGHAQADDITVLALRILPPTA